ncbi:hypothetical protein HDU76_002671, partial [Blyttiomyces sp. JEL0837]
IPSSDDYTTSRLKVHLNGIERDALDAIEGWKVARSGKFPGTRHQWLWGTHYASGEIMRVVRRGVPEWASEMYLGTVVVMEDV